MEELFIISICIQVTTLKIMEQNTEVNTTRKKHENASPPSSPCMNALSVGAVICMSKAQW